MSAPASFGRYEVRRLLGEGEMGTVHLAEDPEIDRLVAIKTFRARPDDGSTEARESRERFDREIRVTGTFDHPNIVTTHDVGSEGGQRFVAMEYVDGCSLAELLGREGALHLDDVLEVTERIADALDYAHARGIVHRDVKPANVLLTSDGVPKITDFGVAHLVGSTLTRHGTTYGSPAYMAPEQATGQPVSGASDQFSLAVIAYEMLTGERPFAGESVTAVIFRILNDEPVPPELLNPRVPEEVGAVVTRALAKDPAGRYPDCGRFAGALREAAGVRTTAARSRPGLAATMANRQGHPARDPRSTGPIATRPGVAPEETVPAGAAGRDASTPDTSSPGTADLARAVRASTATATRAAGSGAAWARSRPRLAAALAAVTLLAGAYWLVGGTPGGATTTDGPSSVGSTAAGTVGGLAADRGRGPADRSPSTEGGRGPGSEGALPEKLSERATNAAEILRHGMEDPERSIPRWLWQRARCVAVVPGVKEVSFGLGGRYGRGLASCRTGGGWSRPSFVAIRGGSIGLQIGAQSTDLVLLFTSDRAGKRLLETTFTLGGDASVAAGPVGRAGEIGTDVRSETEILSYSRNRGLFAGVSVEGATLTTDREANEEAYGKGVRVSELLSGSEGRLPPELAAFLRSLDQRGP